MKTNTYLRWSLLIPFLVWVLCLLFFLFANMTPMESLVFGQSNTIVELLVIFGAFYLFGIIIWILPYLLLSLILFFSSFIVAPRVMFRIYALSPFAMTLLSLALMNLLLHFNAEEGTFYSSSLFNLEEFMTSTLAIGGVSLLWGYVCVAIGYSIYRLLQRRGIIRDEQPLEPAPQPS